MKILVHTCCAPCLIYPYGILSRRGYEVVAFYYNPNIHPFREYQRRYSTLADYCEKEGIELEVGPYEMERYFQEVLPNLSERCDYCYRMRLSMTAKKARELRIGEFTTTILSSPYQNLDLARKAGTEAAIEYGVLFLFEDMTDGYRESVRISRESGMYRQPYCGCVFSEKERYYKGYLPR